MKRLLLTFVATSLGLAANAADIDGKASLICANVELYECVSGRDCQAVTAQSIEASNLLKVDFRKKQVSGVGPAASRPATAIETRETAGGRIYLQGVDTDAESGDGLAWTMVIDQESGRMSLTAAGDDVVFNVFGSCTPI